MLHFSDVIGPNFKFIRHLVIDHSLHMKSVPRLAYLLARLPHLETFRIRYSPVLDGPTGSANAITPERLMNALGPLLLRLFIQKRSADEVSKIFSFVGQEQLLLDHPFPRLSGKEGWIQCRKQREQFTRAVRTLIKKKFLSASLLSSI